MSTPTTRLRTAIARQRVRREAAVAEQHADVRRRSVQHSSYALGAGAWRGGGSGGGSGCDGGGGGRLTSGEGGAPPDAASQIRSARIRLQPSREGTRLVGGAR